MNRLRQGGRGGGGSLSPMQHVRMGKSHASLTPFDIRDGNGFLTDVHTLVEQFLRGGEEVSDGTFSTSHLCE